jgi:hypothetical protein
VQRAPGIPCALSLQGRDNEIANLGQSCRENEYLCLRFFREAKATKQSIFLCLGMDCFAELVIGRTFVRPGGSQ